MAEVIPKRDGRLTHDEASQQRKADLVLLRASAALPVAERRRTMLEIVLRQEARLKALRDAE